MPKELVYSPEALGARGDDTPAFYPVEHVAVGWDADRGVQIGVVPGPSANITISSNTAAAATGATISGPHGGLWMDLDRAGINRLIRSLRKARDSAYGADA